MQSSLWAKKFDFSGIFFFRNGFLSLFLIEFVQSKFIIHPMRFFSDFFCRFFENMKNCSKNLISETSKNSAFPHSRTIERDFELNLSIKNTQKGQTQNFC
jgi:hypothetical protein